MSDATRDVLIRIRYETLKAKLDSPITSETEKAMREHEATLRRVAQAEREVTKARTEGARAAKEYFTGEVPNDFQKYFKNLASAKKYAWETFGPSGERILKDDPTFMRNMRAIDRENGVVDDSMEGFGKKSRAAFSSSLEGVTNLTRGLALLGTNGTADAHKLLEKLVAIQGTIDMLRGGAQIARMGPVIGGVTAVVTAGAAAWMAYEHQVEKAKQQLKEMDDVARRHRDTENRLRESLAGINSRAAAEITDSAIRPDERERRRAAETADIEARMREQLPYASKLEEAAIRERGKKAEAEKQEAAERLKSSDAFWVLDPLGSKRHANLAEAQKEIAEKAGKNYEELMKQRIGVGEQQAAGQRRLLEIEQSRYQDKVSEVERNRDSELAITRGKLENMRARDAMMNPGQRAMREIQDELYNRNRRQLAKAMDGMPGFAGPGGGFMDAAINTAITTTPQQIREGSLNYQAFGSNLKAESQVNDLNQAFEKTFSDMRDMIRRVDTANAELKSKLDSAHPN